MSLFKRVLLWHLQGKEEIFYFLLVTDLSEVMSPFEVVAPGMVLEGRLRSRVVLVLSEVLWR